ncbi:hypothetical protein V2G26_015238 [Clonostachys chloroleuca]
MDFSPWIARTSASNLLPNRQSRTPSATPFIWALTGENGGNLEKLVVGQFCIRISSPVESDNPHVSSPVCGRAAARPSPHARSYVDQHPSTTIQQYAHTENAVITFQIVFGAINHITYLNCRLRTPKRVDPKKQLPPPSGAANWVLVCRSHFILWS